MRLTGILHFNQLTSEIYFALPGEALVIIWHRPTPIQIRVMAQAKPLSAQLSVNK